MHRSWSFPSRKYRWIGWSYYRLCENFWWLIIVSREQYWPQKCFFLLSFTRILSVLWDLGVLGFDIPQKFQFLAMFLVFPVVNWDPKWTKIVNFGCVALEPKYKISADLSNTVFILLETKSQSLWSKFQQDRSIFGGVRHENSEKGANSWWWVDSKNFENFKLHNHTSYTDETPATNMYLNKVFQLAKSWSVTHIIGCKTA